MTGPAAHCAHCGALHHRRLLKPVQGGWLCMDYAACEWLHDLGKAQCIHGTPADESCWVCETVELPDDATRVLYENLDELLLL